MSWLNFYRSDLGKKVFMAVSGLVLFGFVLVHMLGNLKLYLGPDELNHYAEWLREVGSPLLPHSGLLWIFRLVLVGAVAVHIAAATQLTLQNRRSRPHSYKQREVIQSTYASRTMMWGGVIIALFVVYHLAHLTWGASWAHGDFRSGNVYHNVVSGFRVWWVSALYVVAQIALGFHLSHGLWSVFQTLGVPGSGGNHDWRRSFARIFASIIVLGNLSFPVAVLTGLVE